MASRCDVCGRTPQYGSNVSHSNRHTNRRWLVNVHKVTTTIGNVTKKLQICTRCQRTLVKKNMVGI